MQENETTNEIAPAPGNFVQSCTQLTTQPLFVSRQYNDPSVIQRNAQLRGMVWRSGAMANGKKANVTA
jgi:hypothetical protein